MVILDGRCLSGAWFLPTSAENALNPKQRTLNRVRCVGSCCCLDLPVPKLNSKEMLICRKHFPV